MLSGKITEEGSGAYPAAVPGYGNPNKRQSDLRTTITSKQRTALLFGKAVRLVQYADVPRVRGGGGVEPSSKQRNPKTFYTLILRLILLPQPGRRRPSYGPSLLIFANRYRHPIRYFRLNDTPVPSATERRLRRGTRLTASLDCRIKPFYSVKLSSECIAIIAICSLSIQFYESPHNARRAYNQTLPAVKTGQPLIGIALP